MPFRPISRRALLRGGGAVAIALPVLPSLLGRAFAETPPGLAAQRLVAIHIPYGGCREHWFPADSVMADAPRLSARAVARRIADIPGDLSPVLSRAIWGDLLDTMIVLDGIDGLPTLGHDKAYGLTGWNNEDTPPPAPSIDQIIAERSAIYDGEPALRTLNIANGPGYHSGLSLSYGPGGVVIPQMQDPAEVWDYVFSRAATSDDARREIERLRATQRSVLDHVSESHARLMANPRLGAVDRQRVEAYLTYLREYEASVAGSSASVCAPPERPDPSAYPRGTLAHEHRALDHARNVAHVVRCDLTRVITFNLEPTSREYRHVSEAISSHHHSLSHSKDSTTASVRDSARAAHLEIDRFHARMIAALVRGLDEVADPATGRTFLDDTIVVVTNDMGTVSNHRGQRMPVLMFGGRGVLRQGTLIDFRGSHEILHQNGARERLGIAYNDVLVTLCQMFGLAPEQYEHGQRGIGDYGRRLAFYRDYPGGQAAFEEFAFGDRRRPIGELLL